MRGRHRQSLGLSEDSWDVVLVNWLLPHFGTLPALALLWEDNLDLPFIKDNSHHSWSRRGAGSLSKRKNKLSCRTASLKELKSIGFRT